MVHNGIEYGLMMAYAEGYELLAAEELVADPRPSSKRGPTAQWCGPGCSSCSAKALKEDPKFVEISGYTEDSGEGRWTVEEASAIGFRCR